MRALKRLVFGLQALGRRREREQELDAELRDFLDRSVEQKLRQGLPHDAALRAARLELGGVAAVKDRVADVQWETRLEELWRDVRYAFRKLGRTPAFTGVAILTLALGIGANTAVFSIVNAVFLRGLPYPDADSLFRIQRSNNRVGGFSISPAIYARWREHGELFDSIGVIAGMRPATFLADRNPVSVQTVVLSPGVLSALGVRPQRGRLLDAGDERPAAADAALISDDFWATRLGRDADIVGKTLSVNGSAVTIVGVLPPGFELPVPYTKGAQIWLPYRLAADAENNASNNLTCFAKLGDGVTPTQAMSALTPALADLSREFPELIRSTEQARLVPLQTVRQMGAGTGPLLLLGAVGFVLLIACVNIANLLLARATARQREMAIRVSLGASRGRVIRQILTESVVLGVLGAVAGTVACAATFDAVLALVPSGLPYVGTIGIDRRVLTFTLALGVLTGVMFGFAPALTLGKAGAIASRDAAGRASANRERRRLASSLMVSEIALGLILVIGAGLLLESLGRLMRVDLGFDPDRVSTFAVTLPGTYDAPGKRLAVYDDLQEEIGRYQGVEHVAYINGLPLSQGDTLFRIEGSADPDRAIAGARIRFASPGYFDVMRIPLLSGRGITRQDSSISEPVAVINRSMAERYWPRGDAIGSFVWVGQPMGPAYTEPAPRRIVGVVGDVRGYSVAGGFSDDMYMPASQSSGAGSVSFAVRIDDRARGLNIAVTDLLRRSLPDQPVGSIRTMREVIAASPAVDAQRFHTVLLGLFGALGLLIVAVGVYGVTSYVVAQRTQEFGIRIALGATPGTVRTMVLKNGLKLSLIGAAIGAFCSLGLSRLLAGLLFDVRPDDPLTIAGASATMVAVTLIACWIPARHATRVEPLVAFRSH